MLVFIDDSGDPGFKLEKGSSKCFVGSIHAAFSGKNTNYLDKFKKSKRVEDIWDFK